MTKQLRISDTLSLPLDWMLNATVVYGARGTGKTVFSAVMAEEIARSGQRFCAIDLKGDFYGLKSSADGKSEGLPIIIFGGDHADVPLEPDAGELVAETVASLEQSCALDFENMSKGKQIRFLGKFFSTLYHVNRNPLTLFCDEAQRYASQKPMDPDAAICLGAVEDTVKLGRKHALGVVITTQRGSSLNKEVSELCELLVAFRTPGPLDQDRIKGWLDANATKAERDSVMAKLSGLATGTAVFASAHPSLKLFGVHSVRMRETFDSSATPKIGQRRAEPKKLASPDLAALKEKMSAAIERAKADDPKALRAELVTLRKRVAELERAPVKVETKTREVPALTAKDRAALERTVDRLEAFAGRIEAVCAELNTHAPHARATADTLRKALGASLGPPIAPIAEMQALERAVRDRQERRAAAPPPPRRSNGHAGAADPSLPKGERITLIAIAQHPDGVTREQLTVLTGYKRSSRDAYLQRLRERGHVEARGERILATESGVAALGSDYELLPTGVALQEYWLADGRLPAGERVVLRAVCRAYPKLVSREKIDELTGYKRSSRDAYLQRLGARRLVNSAREGVVASAELFA